MSNVYSAFNLYVDGKQKRLKVNLREMQGTSEISSQHPCKSNCTVILRDFLSKRNSTVRFQISQENRSDYCACPTAIGKRTSLLNCKIHLCVSQDFKNKKSERRSLVKVRTFVRSVAT